LHVAAAKSALQRLRRAAITQLFLLLDRLGGAPFAILSSRGAQSAVLFAPSYFLLSLLARYASLGYYLRTAFFRDCMRAYRDDRRGDNESAYENRPH
jgi:hypothetical protein